MKKVGTSREEKQLPYYKYFEQELAPVPKEKIAVLEMGPREGETAVPFEQKDLFLAGKDDGYCQLGFGIMDDGTGISEAVLQESGGFWIRCFPHRE